MYLPNSTSGTMYAMHREYSEVYGRFLTPDPYQASGGVADPGSWNRYGYTRGDPVNRTDRNGLQDETEGSPVRFNCSRFEWIPWDVCRSWTSSPGSKGGDEALPKESRKRKVRLSQPSKSGRNQTRIIDALTDIARSLDEDCAKFFGGRDGVLSRISELINDGSSPYIAHGVMQSEINAFTGGRSGDFEGESLSQAEDAIGAFAIMVNDNGAFFSAGGSTNNGKVTGATSAARSFILLHELAHSLDVSGFQPDYQNAPAGKANNNLINDNCERTFNH
ncbi:MAG: hypothetical protein NTY38_06315 [Acidobacteria bacterium]|nr:hypothetical protein [Acidobacteriota bacterium]